MIGFLIFDTDFIDIEKAENNILRLKTFDLLEKITFQNTEVLFFQNKYKNNYLLKNEQFVLCATGTFIYKAQKGNEALRQVVQKLENNIDIKDIYKDFRGHYNLVCLNLITSEIALYTDKEGTQNSFICAQNGKEALSSNMLLLASLIDTSLDQIAIWEYIHISISMKSKTIFKNIKRCEPGMVFKKTNGKWFRKKLWKINVNHPYLQDSDPEIIEKTSAMFRRDLDVLSNMQGEKIIADLSGGTDTRTILSFLLKYHDNFTVSTAGPSNHLDVIISKKIAKKLGLEFYWYEDSDKNLEISHEKINEAIEIADGILNPFGLLKSLPFIKEKAKKFEMILGGNGGPLFKDHFWLFEFNRINRKREPNWTRIANFALNDHPVQDKLFIKPSKKIYTYMADMFLEHSMQIDGTNNQKLDFVYFDLKCPVFMAPQFSLTNQFFDVYHPMLNGDIVEYMVNIKPDIRKRNTLQFSMIYNSNKKLAWIKTDNAMPAVPSTGKFSFLRIYVFWRYFRAFLRKFYIIVLKKNFVKQVHSLGGLEKHLKELGYFDLLDYNSMKISSMLSEKEFNRILNQPFESSNFSYLLNILAVEIFIKHVEELGNKTISL